MPLSTGSFFTFWSSSSECLPVPRHAPHLHDIGSALRQSSSLLDYDIHSLLTTFPFIIFCIPFIHPCLTFCCFPPIHCTFRLSNFSSTSLRRFVLRPSAVVANFLFTGASGPSALLPILHLRTRITPASSSVACPLQEARRVFRLRLL